MYIIKKRVTKPFSFPTIEGAPSVKILFTLLKQEDSLFTSKNSFTALKMSSPVVVEGSALSPSKSSTKLLPLKYRTNKQSSDWSVLSVDSSKAIAKFSLCEAQKLQKREYLQTKDQRDDWWLNQIVESI